MNRTIRDFKDIEFFEILKIPSEELREPTKDSKKIRNSLTIRNQISRNVRIEKYIDILI